MTCGCGALSESGSDLPVAAAAAARWDETRAAWYVTTSARVLVLKSYFGARKSCWSVRMSSSFTSRRNSVMHGADKGTREYMAKTSTPWYGGSLCLMSTSLGKEVIASADGKPDIGEEYGWYRAWRAPRRHKSPRPG